MIFRGRRYHEMLEAQIVLAPLAEKRKTFCKEDWRK